mmetsp:Transcript_31570/g.89651  ORF Transcript_31570/g.89651 Transcript_31570/m.89651 type:complete len:128 (+) Transcript_31570:570-953(+)
MPIQGAPPPSPKSSRRVATCGACGTSTSTSRRTSELSWGATTLAEQLTPNIRYWAGYRYDVFTTGSISTQLGEGLNRFIKKHLSLTSPLMKLYEEIVHKEQREAAHNLVADIVVQVLPPPPLNGQLH